MILPDCRQENKLFQKDRFFWHVQNRCNRCSVSFRQKVHFLLSMNPRILVFVRYCWLIVADVEICAVRGQLLSSWPFDQCRYTVAIFLDLIWFLHPFFGHVRRLIKCNVHSWFVVGRFTETSRGHWTIRLVIMTSILPYLWLWRNQIDLVSHRRTDCRTLGLFCKMITFIIYRICALIVQSRTAKANVKSLFYFCVCSGADYEKSDRRRDVILLFWGLRRIEVK